MLGLTHVQHSQHLEKTAIINDDEMALAIIKTLLQ